MKNVESESQRICAHCLVERLPTDFYSKKYGPDKVCKPCRREQRCKRYFATPPEGAENAEAASSEAATEASKPEVAAAKAPLLNAEEIRNLAEAFLVLEQWQEQADAQRNLSNPKQNENSRQS